MNALPVLAALRAEDITFWWVSLGMGLVVLGVVIMLLTFLLSLVRDIDNGVKSVLGAALGVAGNTERLQALKTTAGAVEEIKKEALIHDAFLKGKL